MNKKDVNYYMNLNYPIEIITHSDEDDTWYEANIPQLGRMTFHGTGNTIEDAINSLNIVKEELFEIFLTEEKEIPVPDDPDEEFSGRFVLRMDKELHKELVYSARKKEISLNKHINTILNSWKFCENSTSLNNFENLAFKSFQKGIDRAISNLENTKNQSGWEFGYMDIGKSPLISKNIPDICGTEDVSDLSRIAA